MKTKTTRIHSIDLVISLFLIKLDEIMRYSCIKNIWNSPLLWKFSFNRLTLVSKKNEERPSEGFRIHPNSWRDDSFINIIMERSKEFGWRVKFGYIENPDLGVYNQFHFQCSGDGIRLMISPRLSTLHDRFTVDPRAVSDFERSKWANFTNNFLTQFH